MRSLSTTTPTLARTAGEAHQTKEPNQLQQVKTNTEVLDSVDKLVSQGQEGRLFAIVHICGKQFRITDGDIILIEGYWPPSTGDQIRLDKVLVVGGKDFSLIGTPILQPGVVDIQATVIEKTLTHTKTNFRKKKTKQFMRINFDRNQLTMLRINSIEIRKSMKEASQPQQSDENVKIY